MSKRENKIFILKGCMGTQQKKQSKTKEMKKENHEEKREEIGSGRRTWK